MFSELDALFALADDLYSHNQRQKTLMIIDSIYEIFDLNQINYIEPQSKKIIIHSDNLK